MVKDLASVSMHCVMELRFIIFFLDEFLSINVGKFYFLNFNYLIQGGLNL